MTVRVSELDPPRRLQWVGTVGPKRPFRGRHTFDLDALEEGRTGLVNREEVTGLLVPLAVSETPERDYERMNRALAERVEGRPASDRDT